MPIADTGSRVARWNVRGPGLWRWLHFAIAWGAGPGMFARVVLDARAFSRIAAPDLEFDAYLGIAPFALAVAVLMPALWRRWPWQDVRIASVTAFWIGWACALIPYGGPPLLWFGLAASLLLPLAALYAGRAELSPLWRWRHAVAVLVILSGCLFVRASSPGSGAWPNRTVMLGDERGFTSWEFRRARAAHERATAAFDAGDYERAVRIWRTIEFVPCVRSDMHEVRRGLDDARERLRRGGED